MSPASPPTGQGSGGQPAGGRAVSFRALPLRLVVAGRFGLEAGRLHRLDADGVGGLLERTAPELALRVADRLRADGTDLSVRLQFRHRKDFGAGAVARSIPDLARLVAAHDAIRSGTRPADLREDLSEFATLRALVETTERAPARPAAGPPSATPSQPGDDSLDRLLDMVDAPGQPAAPRADPARSAVSSFIAEVTRGNARRAGAVDPPEALEAALAGQIEAVLQHPDFAALERSWAALLFLARRIDFRSATTVDVLEADADALADALEALVPDDDPDPAGPVRLVVDLSDYDASDRDVARLGRLAAFGASRRAVVLANADPAFCGDAGPEGLAGMHDPETLFDTVGFTGWRNLRDSADAAWLGLCLSRLALRDAVDGRDDRVLRFSRPHRIGGPLDVGVAPAVAALIAEAAAATQWACAVGTATDPQVENLILVQDRAAAFEGPVRPAPRVTAADSLASAGLIVLVPERGRDSARLLRLPAVGRGGDRAATSLGTRLFQAQVVHGLQWNADRIFGASDPRELRDRIESYLAALLGGTGPGAQAGVRFERDPDDEQVIAVEVRSGARAAPGATMAFDIPIGSHGASGDGEP